MFLSTTNNGTVTDVGSGSQDLEFIQVYNNDAAVRYVQFFNAASGDVTLGTTVPYRVMVLPADGGNTWQFKNGIKFPVACSFAVTTTRTGNTAPTAAADVEIEF